jgi:hypothetical protein
MPPRWSVASRVPEPTSASSALSERRPGRRHTRPDTVVDGHLEKGGVVLPGRLGVPGGVRRDGRRWIALAEGDPAGEMVELFVQ